MARSLKKGPFIHYKLDKKVQANIESNKKTVIKTWSRASMISPDFVGQTIAVHNGKCNRKHGWSQVRRIFSNEIFPRSYW